ncbi:MAG TPA: hypothetical protein VFB37_04365 [Steroidobacteraceae bacterium]|nr:hypothetical protein [Steroidobacteraceae bacterium]
MSVRNHIKLVWLVLTNRMHVEIRKHPRQDGVPHETDSTDMLKHAQEASPLSGEGSDYVAPNEDSARSRSASR